MTGFYFHPFNGGLNSSTYVDNHSLLYAGGAFIGLPLTIIFMLIALRYRSPVMFPFIVTGSYGFLHTGIWMIRSLVNPEIATDYTYMIELGSSELLMVVLGVSFILFGIISRVFFLPLAGIDVSVVLKYRLLIYTIGIIPWYVLHSLYNIVFFKSGFTIFLILIIPEFIYIIIETTLSVPLQKRIRVFQSIRAKEISICHFIIIIFIILLLYTSVFIVNSEFGVK